MKQIAPIGPANPLGRNSPGYRDTALFVTKKVRRRPLALTKEQREEIARKAAAARWGKKK